MTWCAPKAPRAIASFTSAFKLLLIIKNIKVQAATMYQYAELISSRARKPARRQGFESRLINQR